MTNLSIVEALGQIAREKNVDRELVVLTLQDALISAAKRRYGSSDNYHAKVDPSTGTMEVTKDLKVVEEVFEDSEEISIDDARDLDSKAQIGSVVVKELNFADFGRNAIQTAKQILVQRVREAEREKIYEEFIRSNVISVENFPETLKGELTVVISEKNHKKNNEKKISESVKIEIKKMLKKYSHKDVVEFISKKEDLQKRVVYNFCLSLKK